MASCKVETSGMQSKLPTIGHDVTILSSRGPASTIGAERCGDGFLQD